MMITEHRTKQALTIAKARNDRSSLLRRWGVRPDLVIELLPPSESKPCYADIAAKKAEEVAKKRKAAAKAAKTARVVKEVEAVERAKAARAAKAMELASQGRHRSRPPIGALR
jgi:hypothetical protein